jgi:hypothetical protein
MKINFLIPIGLAIIIGFLMGKFMFGQYDTDKIIIPVFNQSQTLYFIQYGAYSTFDSMNEEADKLSSYIYSIEDGKYHVYIGITKSKENSAKLEGYFNEKEYSTYVKQLNVSNKQFVDILQQYDALLEKTIDNKSISLICSKVLTKYKELVIDNGNEN